MSTAKRGQARQRARAGLAQSLSSGSDANVSADAIDHEVIRVAALPIGNKLTLPERSRCEDYARSKRDQRLEAAAVQGHVVHELVVHDCADRRRIGL